MELRTPQIQKCV